MRPAALTRKLLRDLWKLRGQALAIAAVVAGGVATWVITFSTIESLETTQRAFYRDYRFTEVFAGVTRAPDRVAARLAQVPGVRALEARVGGQARFAVAGFADPVTARLVSIPAQGAPHLNRLHLRSGRLPEPGRDDEIVISEPFAEAHGLGPGARLEARLEATIQGRRRTLEVVGVGLSPEFVYQIQPGALFPDYERYAIGWMREPVLAAAWDMEGAFNDLVVKLEPGVRPEAVIPAIDRLLAPYGGTGAYGREHQVSHEYLSQELKGLRGSALVVPLLFLGVAAFLLHVVTGRTVQQQREQIAVLKAFGYGNRTVGGHYLLLVALMVLLGALPGLALGAWAGHGMAELYSEFFRFPFLAYRLSPLTAIGAIAVALLAALAGTALAVRRAVALPPAEAMRPEPPASYRPTLVERLGLQRWLDQPTRMILRHLERNPVNAVLSVLGIALAGGLMTVGSFQKDAIDYMIEVQFRLAGREDATVVFTERTARAGLFELVALPGVRAAEPFRAVPVELINGHRRYRTGIQGYEPDARLHRALDTRLQPIRLPPAGLMLSSWIGERLDVGAGDTLTVRLLDGSGDVHRVPVVGTVKEFIGAAAYMRIDALNELLDEAPVLSGAYLSLTPGSAQDVYDRLERRPRVAAITQRQASIDAFLDTMGDTLLVFAFVNTLLAGSIALGVVYNAARLAYSERARELGSLRILGFTRAETAYILLGELALLTVVAIPLSWLIGQGFCSLVSIGLASELYRIPVVIEPSTYGFAAVVIIAAALISAAAIAHRLYRMDLVDVLKVRE
ncbi:MAG: ABC transporter permease [Halofilum sp. (in: g-proteobacteria)]|nr:ABC transporter permease [Halofilum sp. (in: g-proteobacteria)]